jgi:PAS domain S-box-containing protein
LSLQPQPRPRTLLAPEPPESRAGVVIADDSADIRLLLRLRLEQEGFSVVGEAADGAQLVDIVEAVQPAVVVVDVAMPGMGGLEAAALVRARCPEVRIVVLSGYGRDRMGADAERAGADAYVEKTAAGTELFDVLDRLVAGGRRRPPVDVPPVGNGDVLYRLLLDALAEGVVLLTPDGAVQSANSAAGRLFGRPVESLVGASWVQLGELTSAGQPADRHSSFVLGALRNGDSGAREVALHLGDGEVRWVLISVRTLRPHDGGAPYAAVVSLLDVTDRHALAREREVSQALQRAVLPARLPEVEGVSLAAAYAPGGEDTEVGGDWYDAVALPDGSVVLVVGDVQGHDVAAAGLMGQIRSVVRSYALEGHHRHWCSSTRTATLLTLGIDRIVAVGLAQLHPAEQVAVVAGAGQLPALLARPDEEPIWLERELGPPLGVDAGTRWRETTVLVPAGSTLVQFTDGLVKHRPSLQAALDDVCAAVSRGRSDVDSLVATLMRTVSRGPRPRRRRGARDAGHAGRAAHPPRPPPAPRPTGQRAGRPLVRRRPPRLLGRAVGGVGHGRAAAQRGGHQRLPAQRRRHRAAGRTPRRPYPLRGERHEPPGAGRARRRPRGDVGTWAAAGGHAGSGLGHRVGRARQRRVVRRAHHRPHHGDVRGGWLALDL